MNATAQQAVNTRYSGLSESSCCLSCGGAINHSDPAEGEICADLGSGRGADVIRLAERVGPAGYVYGIDVSDGMVVKARSNLAKFGVENAEIIQGPLEALPLEDKTLDLIISNCTINHAENKNRVWSEIHRVLKTGGRFVVSDIYSETDVPEQYRTDPQAVAECWAGSVTRKEYLEQLSASGLEQIQILEESDPYEKGAIHVASWTITGRRLDE